MEKVICIYSSSSASIDQRFFDVAERLGKEIAARNDIMLFGGGMTGLMGAAAKAIHENNGQVIGVIPEALNVKGIVYELCDELIVTGNMRERKGMMDDRSDAFIALPGGFGTLEELLEIITLKQLRYHNKPIVILNYDGFYNKLIDLFDDIIYNRFAKEDCRKLYNVSSDIEEALDYIDNYSPFVSAHRWFTDVEKR